MKYISGGTFVLGSDLGQKWEEPLFEVSLDGFCMDVYEYPNQKGQMPIGNISFGKRNENVRKSTNDFVHLQSGNEHVEEPRVGDIPMEITMTCRLVILL